MYEIRIKTDSRGKQHIHCRVPSIRGMAWIEPELPDNEEFRQMILDEDFLPEWKKAWLAIQYEDFLVKERKRKNEVQEEDIEEIALSEVGDMPSHLLGPDEALIQKMEAQEREEKLQKCLSVLNAKERKYLLMHHVEDLSFKEIAEREVVEELITKRAAAIQRMVSRARKKMSDFLKS